MGGRSFHRGSGGFEWAILCPVRKGEAANRALERKTPSQRKKVLFFCACNSVRSQMAEGLVRGLYGDRLEAFSAGLKPAPLSPTATRVMAEIGIDISSHMLKSIQAFVGTKFDCVAMVCGDPKGTRPFLPHSRLDFACAGRSGCFRPPPLLLEGKPSPARPVPEPHRQGGSGAHRGFPEGEGRDQGVDNTSTL